MRLGIDTSGVQFTVTTNTAQKLDQNGKQKIDRDGRPMWTTQVMALDETGGEILAITWPASRLPPLWVRWSSRSGWRRSRGTTTGSTACPPRCAMIGNHVHFQDQFLNGPRTPVHGGCERLWTSRSDGIQCLSTRPFIQSYSTLSQTYWSRQDMSPRAKASNTSANPSEVGTSVP